MSGLLDDTWECASIKPVIRASDPRSVLSLSTVKRFCKRVLRRCDLCSLTGKQVRVLETSIQRFAWAIREPKPSLCLASEEGSCGMRHLLWSAYGFQSQSMQPRGTRGSGGTWQPRGINQKGRRRHPYWAKYRLAPSSLLFPSRPMIGCALLKQSATCFCRHQEYSKTIDQGGGAS